MSEEKKMKLGGVIPAVITPLQENGKIDERSLEKQVAYLSGAGVHGFLVNGTTGEGPFLSEQERRRTFEVVRDIRKADQFLCVGCLASSTEQTIDEILAFKSLSPDFVVVTSPYYFGATQREIIWHFKEIAHRSPFPVIAYEISPCTHNKIGLEAMMEIASMDNVVGLKDSSGDFITFSRVLFQTGKQDFVWIMGNDYLDGDALTLGAKGIVTGLGNVWIVPYLEMFKAAEERDFATVHKIQGKINKLYEVIETVGGRGNPAVKGGVSLLGRCGKWVKAPIMPLDGEELSRVRQILVELDLISG